MPRAASSSNDGSEGFAHVIEQGAGQLVGNAGAAKARGMGTCLPGIRGLTMARASGLRSGGVWWSVMMTSEPARDGLSDFVGVADAAIDRHDKGLRPGQPMRATAVWRHAVPFRHRVRQVRNDLRAKPVSGFPLVSRFR